jgi:hypothetical protein
VQGRDLQWKLVDRQRQRTGSMVTVNQLGVKLRTISASDLAS